jgi:hypothetical protein
MHGMIGSTRPVVRSLQQTCLVAPSQWEGRLADGRMFYVRVRDGRLQVRLSPAPTSDVMEAAGGQAVVDLHQDDPHKCFMEEPAMKALAAAALDFSEVEETPGA